MALGVKFQQRNGGKDINMQSLALIKDVCVNELRLTQPTDCLTQQ